MASSRKHWMDWVRLLVCCAVSCAWVSCEGFGGLAPSGTATQVRCVPKGCMSGAVYDGPLSLDGYDPLGIVVIVERNRVTASSSLWKTEKAGQYVGRIVGPLSVHLFLDTQTTPAHLVVQIENRPEFLLDGDDYILSVYFQDIRLLSRSRYDSVYDRIGFSDANCAEPCVTLTL